LKYETKVPIKEEYILEFLMEHEYKIEQAMNSIKNSYEYFLIFIECKINFYIILDKNKNKQEIRKEEINNRTRKSR
jgi:hypothetical protein